jgi:hypothetical protein
MSIRPHIIIPVLLLLAAAGTNGCYTMLYHPPVAMIDDATGREDPVAVDRSERCTDCHTGQMHGSMDRRAMNSAHVSDGWYDYDPFHRYDSFGYYDPFFYGTPLRSPYFYDNYYSYRNYPWWLSYRNYDDDDYYDGGSGGGVGSGSGSSVREKPSRRGGEDTRGYSPLPSSPRSSPNTEKPSSSTPSSGGSSSGGDDDSKEKPARRGGVK